MATFREIAIFVNPVCYIKIQTAEFLVCTGPIFGISTSNEMQRPYITHVKGKTKFSFYFFAPSPNSTCVANNELNNNNIGIDLFYAITLHP